MMIKEKFQLNIPDTAIIKMGKAYPSGDFWTVLISQNRQYQSLAVHLESQKRGSDSQEEAPELCLGGLYSEQYACAT